VTQPIALNAVVKGASPAKPRRGARAPEGAGPVSSISRRRVSAVDLPERWLTLEAWSASWNLASEAGALPGLPGAAQGMRLALIVSVTLRIAFRLTVQVVSSEETESQPVQGLAANWAKLPSVAVSVTLPSLPAKSPVQVIEGELSL
jgi:hypothetical protein